MFALFCRMPSASSGVIEPGGAVTCRPVTFLAQRDAKLLQILKQ